MPASEKNRSGPHGAASLPLVSVDSYNLELRNAEGFLGDKASKRAFSAILDDWRERVRKVDDQDPLGNKPSPDLSKRRLDEILTKGDIEAAGVIQGAIEDFAQELASVLRRFLRTKGWQDTERIVVGGGFRASRIGELAIGRTSVLLKSEGVSVDLVPIRHHPDEAGLIGSAQLMPAWTLAGHDALLAIDIGGTNIRTGVVQLNTAKAKDLTEAAVWKSELWRHADESPDRSDTVARMVKMLIHFIERAQKEGLTLAPFIGIGCPGVIEPNGRIDRGGQNLPGGDWEDEDFNLPDALAAGLPKVGGHAVVVVMHNDAVVQGLSEAPFMGDVKHWGVVTIGTGLGNARFSNHNAETADKDNPAKQHPSSERTSSKDSGK